MKPSVTGQAHEGGTVQCTLPSPEHDSTHQQSLGRGVGGTNSSEAAHLGRATHHQVSELRGTDSSRLRACQSASPTHYVHKGHSGA